MSHCQSDIALIPVTKIVGTAVRKRARHAGAGSLQIRRRSIYETGNSAHDGALFSRVDVLITPRAEEAQVYAVGREGAHLPKAEAGHEALGFRR